MSSELLQGLSPEPDTPCHLLLAEGAQHRQPRGLLEVGAGIPVTSLPPDRLLDCCQFFE